MDSSLHWGISTNEITHFQGDHPHLSRFLKNLTIRTDTSDTQLCAVIMQEDNHFSRKRSKSEINYTMTEKELLNIVETLKEFKSILLEHEKKVFTDHNNITYETI